MSARMKTVAAAVLIAASLTVPATAHADDPVPTVDQVVAIMAELTDPGRPAASKTDIVAPGFAPDEAGTIDDHLNNLNGRGYIPFHFVVTDIEPAPGNTAGATVAVPNTFPYYSVRPCPIVLVNQGGHWMIVHDAAMVWLNAMRSNTHPRDYAF
jgi:hypothetical protein